MAVLITAVEQLEKRFAQIDWEGSLWFALLRHVVKNAKTRDNAALAADATRLESFAFDVWDEQQRSETISDQKARPILEIDVLRLLRHWQRSVIPPTNKRGQRQAFAASLDGDRAKELLGGQIGFIVKELVEQPTPWKPVTVVFTARVVDIMQTPERRAPNDLPENAPLHHGRPRRRKGPQPKNTHERVPVLLLDAEIIEGSADSAAEAPSNDAKPRKPPLRHDPTDPAVLLPDHSVRRALDDNARSLATAFRSYGQRKFQWNDTTCYITVVRQRPILRTALAIAGSALLTLAAGCAWLQNRETTMIRKDLYSISKGMFADTDCSSPKPFVNVAWEQPLPDFKTIRVRLLRNGTPIAVVNGLRTYEDHTVEVGKSYWYTLDSITWWGHVIKEQSTPLVPRVICPPAPGPQAVSITPTIGKWDTPFTLHFEPPVVDGVLKPHLQSWNWQGTQLDAKNEFYELWTAPSQEATITHLFTPCDQCSSMRRDSTGSRLYECRAALRVLSADGTLRLYHAFATVRDDPPSQCSGGRAVPAPP